MSPPAPPSASGIGTPSSPSPAAWRSSASGKRPCASSSSATGAITPSAKARTVSRNRRCSSERSRSTLRTIPAAYDAGVDGGSLARYADAIVRDGLLIGAGRCARDPPRADPARAGRGAHRGGLPRRCALRRRARDRPAHHARPCAARRRGHARLAPGLGGRAHARAGARGRGDRVDRRQRGSAGAGGRAARARGAARHRPRRAAALPTRRREGRRALRRGRVAHARVGGPGLPGARRRRGGREARCGHPGVRPPRRRRSRRRLAAPRRAARGARGTADGDRPARDPSDGARHRPPARPARGHELARGPQRRPRASHHAEHPHGGGVHEPGAGRHERPVPLHAPARARRAG